MKTNIKKQKKWTMHIVRLDEIETKALIRLHKLMKDCNKSDIFRKAVLAFDENMRGNAATRS